MRRASREGSVLGIFLALLGLLALVFAGFTAVEVARNRQATEMTLAEFVETRPQATWLKLTRCQVNLEAAVYEYSSENEQQVHRVYIPVHPPGEPAPAPVVIASREHAAIVAGALELQEDEAALERYLEENQERFQEVADFEGWLTSPTEAVASRLEAEEVTPDYVVLEVGQVKTWSEVAGPGGLGLLLLVLSLLLLRRKAD